MAAIGIDLGTTHCCVGAWVHHSGTDEDGGVEIMINDMGKRTTPSFVAFTDTDRLVGQNAKEHASHHPENTVYNAKRLIGRRFSDKAVQDDIKHWSFAVVQGPHETPQVSVEFGGRAMQFAPQQISAMLLRKMKEYAEAQLDTQVTQAVITVPAYFSDRQRAATKDAGEIAGLEVLRIINESTAAALTYGLEVKAADTRKVLIYDLGGGTCDVCILEVGGGRFETLAVAGDTHLGGADLNNCIVNHWLQEIETEHGLDLSSDANCKAIRKARRLLHDRAETAKLALSTTDSFTVEIDNLHHGTSFHTRLMRARFNHICAHHFCASMDLVRACLLDAEVAPEDVDEVVLVGGSSRIPKIQSLLQQIFPDKTLNKRINRDEAVAYGAAVQAAMLADSRPSMLRAVTLRDVTPLSLDIGLQGDRVAVLLRKDTRIPTSVTRRNFALPAGECAAVSIPVYEGEARVAEDENMLGEFALLGLPRSGTGSRQVEVTFAIDANGILAVKAMHVGSGMWRQMWVDYKSGALSSEDVERMKAEVAVPLSV